MVTRTKGSTWNLEDNSGSVSLLDYEPLKVGTDWSLSFAAAVARAQVIGGAMQIPGGIYEISPQVIPAGVLVFGEGTLKAFGTSQGSLLTLAAGAQLKGITLNGNNSIVTSGAWSLVSVINANNIAIQEVQFVDASGDCITISGAASTQILISDCKFIGFKGNGITINSGDDIIISQCRMEAPNNAAITGNGIALQSDGSAISGISISQLHARGMKGAGIKLLGIGTRNITDVMIGQCYILSSATSGILATLVERMNVINSCIKNSTTYGINLQGDVQFCRISNSMAVGNVTGMAEVLSGTTPNNNTFSFNVLSGNTNNTVITLGVNSVVL